MSMPSSMCQEIVQPQPVFGDRGGEEAHLLHAKVAGIQRAQVMRATCSSFLMALGMRVPTAVIGDVVHLAAESIDGEHGVALFRRHQPHGQIKAELLLAFFCTALAAPRIADIFCVGHACPCRLRRISAKPGKRFRNRAKDVLLGMMHAFGQPGSRHTCIQHGVQHRRPGSGSGRLPAPAGRLLSHWRIRPRSLQQFGILSRQAGDHSRVSAGLARAVAQRLDRRVPAGQQRFGDIDNGSVRGNPWAQSCRWLMICNAAHKRTHWRATGLWLSPCTSSTKASHRHGAVAAIIPSASSQRVITQLGAVAAKGFQEIQRMHRRQARSFNISRSGDAFRHRIAFAGQAGAHLFQQFASFSSGGVSAWSATSSAARTKLIERHHRRAMPWRDQNGSHRESSRPCGLCRIGVQRHGSCRTCFPASAWTAAFPHGRPCPTNAGIADCKVKPA